MTNLFPYLSLLYFIGKTNLFFARQDRDKNETLCLRQDETETIKELQYKSETEKLQK